MPHRQGTTTYAHERVALANGLIIQGVPSGVRQGEEALLADVLTAQEGARPPQCALLGLHLILDLDPRPRCVPCSTA